MNYSQQKLAIWEYTGVLFLAYTSVRKVGAYGLKWNHLIMQ